FLVSRDDGLEFNIVARRFQFALRLALDLPRGDGDYDQLHQQQPNYAPARGLQVPETIPSWERSASGLRASMKRPAEKKGATDKNSQAGGAALPGATPNHIFLESCEFWVHHIPS